MDLVPDSRLIIGVLIAAASSWLLIIIVRKILDAINSAMGGKFYEKGRVKKAGIFFDTLLPILPCVPSGLLAVLIMHYWPPDALWDNSILHFCAGALAGSVAAQIYQTITRGFEKRAERLAASKPPAKPDPPIRE